MKAVIAPSRSTRWRTLGLALAATLAPLFAQAQSAGDYAALPPTVVDSTTPLVMLAMSRDNQLWHKAYNDYSDLDGDGALDTVYSDDIEYYGYFHSDYCYGYAGGVFSPSSSVSPGTHQCSGAWSGNFLNWLTTTRIDVVRKVLYGGYRSTDTATSTILQRAYVPPDNHAFVKIVDDVNVINNFTPITGQSVLSFCNVTDFDGASSDISGDIDIAAYPPLIKVAVGKHVTWAGSERQQCQFADDEGGPGFQHAPFSPDRPSAGSIAGIPSDSELIVRVAACVDGFDRADIDACKRYVDGSGTESYKPYGLLQTYGETGTYKFGLITGSYANNTDGGVLRKNIVFMGGDESAAADREIDADTGVFINQGSTAAGIVKTLNLLRIQGWDYGDTHYDDCDTPGIDKSTFLTSGAANRQCRDWGNPISEIYLEALRYFAGATPTAGFAANDTTILPGLTSASWADPFSADAPCSKCSIIVLSTGLNNFDGDQLASASALPGLSGAADLESYTDAVGVAEGLNVGSYIVGEGSFGGTSEECDAKFLTNFSDARGPCPEVPSLEGTFNIAGAAYYGQQTDLRPDLDGTQNTKTYTVSLAESLPSFEITTSNGNSVSIVPTCRSNDGTAAPSDAGWLECSLVDLTVVEQTSVYGRYLIAWEDSPWGNDYDMDAYAVLEYCTATGSASDVRDECENYTNNENSSYEDAAPSNGYNYGWHDDRPNWDNASAGQVQIRMSVVGAAAGFSMTFGYTMNGTFPGLADGAYVNEIVRYGNYNFNSVAEAIPGATGAEADRIIWSRNARKFTAGTTTPGLLQNPLWYSAKYGNFDNRANALPDVLSEWDNFDLLGNRTSDGIPDAYFPVSNPANLLPSLDRVFADINTRVSAGSAAAVNAQTGAGEGAIYQALYTPRIEDGNGNSVSWIGTLNALFIDERGQLREDRDGDGILENSDRILDIEFDAAADEALVQAYLVNADGSRGAADGDPFSLSSDDYYPIWSAQDELAVLTDLTNQRIYTAPASGGRYIFTAFDRDGDGSIIDPVFTANNPGQSATEDGVHAFVAANFAPTGATENDRRYLGFTANPATADETTALAGDISDLVNYVRGQEGIAGARSRTLAGERYILGDIVHSTPTVVGKPADRYDLIYNDDSYRQYYEQYLNRRNVVYVGANDGMLHAFNGGFFNFTNTAFEENGSHPLGSEIWAYVPFNVLPHLQWLASPTYPHVYYVDGPVQAFDVNIFPDDAVHPNGWGTIIVASMRFGGGEYALDHDNDNTTADITTRSAYIIFDVTDPESPPELIAELADADLGYTTARPTVVKYRTPNSSGSYLGGGVGNGWYLVFGSGPSGSDAAARTAALEDAVSDQPANIYVFDLVNRTLAEHAMPEIDTFVGGVEAADWNLDYVDDALYFGLVGGTPQNPSGKLKRASLALGGGFTPAFGDLYGGSDLAFSATPSVFRRGAEERWVHVGSGRLYVPEDNVSTEQQFMFGIKDPFAPGDATLPAPVPDLNLVDTTGIDVFQDGLVRGAGGAAVTVSAAGSSQAVDTFDDILRFVEDNTGWKFALRSPLDRFNALGGANRIRNSTKAAYAGSTLVSTAYQATGEFCSSEGSGFLYTPHLAAGVPAPFAALGIDDTTQSPNFDPSDPAYRVLEGAELGLGIPSDPVVTRSASGDFIVITQTSSADLDDTSLDRDPVPAGRKSWREIPVNW